jgi:hypothetical protein
MLRALAQSGPPIKYKLFFISRLPRSPPRTAAVKIGGAKRTGAQIYFQRAQL